MNRHTFDPTSLGLSAEPDAELYLPDETTTSSFGAAVARGCEPGDIVGLIGNLGAGKTTFTQGLCEAFGAGRANSPTYTLLNVYPGDVDVFHFDLYRLESVGDLEGVAYWDYVESGAGVSVVEWLDQIPEAWTGQGTVVHLTYRDDGRFARVWSTRDDVCAAVAALEF